MRCNPCSCNAAEGERLKADALATLAQHRKTVIRRGQRALLEFLVCSGTATIDEVREVVELPPNIGPKCFGAVPSPLARAGIIRADGFGKTCRAIAHARPLTRWQLADRDRALRWLADHPDLLDPCEPEVVADKRQGVLFDQEMATPAAGTVGAGR